MHKDLKDDLLELISAVDAVHRTARAETEAFEKAQPVTSKMDLVLLQEAHRSELDAIHVLVARTEVVVRRHADLFASLPPRRKPPE